MQVIALGEQHAEAVSQIYQAGIDTGDATFATTTPGWETFDRVHLPAHRLLAVNDVGEVAGLALHRRAGFRTVGARERIGQRDGR